MVSGLELMFQHKNYHLFWALLKSVDTLNVGDQREIVELQSALAEVTKPQTPLGDCAFEALCLSLLGGRVPYFLPFLFLLCLSGSLSIHPSPKSVGQRWTPVKRLWDIPRVLHSWEQSRVGRLPSNLSLDNWAKSRYSGLQRSQ